MKTAVSRTVIATIVWWALFFGLIQFHLGGSVQAAVWVCVTTVFVMIGVALVFLMFRDLTPSK
jgi:hypothetical protein